MDSCYYRDYICITSGICAEMLRGMRRKKGGVWWSDIDIDIDGDGDGEVVSRNSGIWICRVGCKKGYLF